MNQPQDKNQTNPTAGNTAAPKGPNDPPQAANGHPVSEQYSYPPQNPGMMAPAQGQGPAGNDRNGGAGPGQDAPPYYQHFTNMNSQGQAHEVMRNSYQPYHRPPVTDDPEIAQAMLNLGNETGGPSASGPGPALGAAGGPNKAGEPNINTNGNRNGPGNVNYGPGAGPAPGPGPNQGAPADAQGPGQGQPPMQGGAGYQPSPAPHHRPMQNQQQQQQQHRMMQPPPEMPPMNHHNPHPHQSVQHHHQQQQQHPHHGHGHHNPYYQQHPPPHHYGYGHPGHGHPGMPMDPHQDPMGHLPHSQHHGHPFYTMPPMRGDIPGGPGHHGMPPLKPGSPQKAPQDQYPAHMQQQAPQTKPETTEKKRKRPADMPRRPLSAYNFFFSEERVRVLAEIPDPEKNEEDGDGKGEKKDESKADDKDEGKKDTNKENANEKVEETEQKSVATAERLLQIRDAKSIKRRPHRKSHGKIAFKDLARTIGKRWRALTEEGKVRYSKLAEKDLQRYNEQMKEYNTKRNRFSYNTTPGPLPPQLLNTPGMNVGVGGPTPVGNMMAMNGGPQHHVHGLGPGHMQQQMQGPPHGLAPNPGPGGPAMDMNQLHPHGTGAPHPGMDPMIMNNTMGIPPAGTPGMPMPFKTATEPPKKDAEKVHVTPMPAQNEQNKMNDNGHGSVFANEIVEPAKADVQI